MKVDMQSLMAVAYCHSVPDERGPRALKAAVSIDGGSFYLNGLGSKTLFCNQCLN